MYMGGAMGLGAAFYYEQLSGGSASGIVAVLLAILFSFLGGAFGALIYSFITITLRANQNVTGLALAIFGTGAGQFIGEYMRVTSGGYVAISNELKAVFANSPFPAALQKLLPFSTLALTTLKDRRGVYALIGKDEDRSQSLRRPSVRSKLQQTAAEQKQPAAKKKDLEL